MLTRIITGVVGIAVAACVIQTGGMTFAIGGVILALIAWFEYCRAFAQKGYNPALIIGGIAITALCYTAWTGHMAVLMPFWTVATVLVILAMTVLQHGDFNVGSAMVSLGGIFYLGVPFAHMIALRLLGAGQPVLNTSMGSFEHGCAFIWLALIGTWASDTFAYFAGSFLGKHKMCPAISPKKTIEGFAGGLIGTTLSVAALGNFFSFDLMTMAVLGLCICMVATLGDLVESVMKRYTGIKDSGNIIPGHGGVWDRFDSVLYTIPFVFYFIHFVSIF